MLLAKLLLPCRFIAAALFMICAAFMASPVNAGSLISQSSTGIAIKGYDPVAYFTQGKAVKGSDEISYRWLGATWYFASAEHKGMFEADPIKYVPQYGGYCAASMTNGSFYEADPNAWRIVDGMLYLNYSPSVTVKWAKNISDNISRADVKWAELKPELTK